jgi:CRISPR/Cas system endoribonuclease Cas6 (RAMP superfamily)
MVELEIREDAAVATFKVLSPVLIQKDRNKMKRLARAGQQRN